MTTCHVAVLSIVAGLVTSVDPGNQHGAVPIVAAPRILVTNIDLQRIAVLRRGHVAGLVTSVSRAPRPSPAC